MTKQARKGETGRPRRRRAKRASGSAKLDSVARYRLALVREEDTAYGDLSLTHPEAVARFLQEQLNDRPQEVMAAVFLDTRNRLIAWQIAFVGTLNRAAAEPRAILQMALLTNAAGFVISHNHPSGDPSPSAEDLSFTRRLAEAGDVVGIRLVDHIILGSKDRWISLRQRGGW